MSVNSIYKASPVEPVSYDAQIRIWIPVRIRIRKSRRQLIFENLGDENGYDNSIFFFFLFHLDHF